MLTRGDYEASQLREEELWGRKAVFGRHMVTMGCAIAHSDGVYVFEMNPTSVSGCDIVLMSAAFAPVVRAIFGDDAPIDGSSEADR